MFKYATVPSHCTSFHISFVHHVYYNFSTIILQFPGKRGYVAFVSCISTLLYGVDIPIIVITSGGAGHLIGGCINLVD